MSFSFSFGSSSSVLGHSYNHGQRQQRLSAQNSNPDGRAATYIPQTLVLGLFLLIFGAQVAVNMVHVRRVRRRRVGAREGGRQVNINVDRDRDAGGQPERGRQGEQNREDREDVRPAA